jgi:LacI family transcriptional regulator
VVTRPPTGRPGSATRALADEAAAHRSEARPSVTLKDVASRAGVSFKTVSRVINRQGNVAATMVERVERAVRELGYIPNEGARQLRGARTRAVAVVVRSISDPFFADVGERVEQRLRSRGMAMFAASTHDSPDDEISVVRAMASRRPDGMIITPIAPSQAYVRPYVDDGLSVVTVDRPAAGLNTDAILTDNAGGVRDAFEHLIRHGHERVCMIADSDAVFTARERVAGFRATAEVHGLKIAASWVCMHSPDQAIVRRFIRKVRSQANPPTAIITGNNAITMAAVRELASDPSPPAIVGFDDFVLADLLGITVVAQDTELIASSAVELLFARMDDPSLPPRTVRVPTTLIARGSGERPPAKRPSGANSRAGGRTV